MRARPMTTKFRSEGGMKARESAHDETEGPERLRRSLRKCVRTLELVNRHSMLGRNTHEQIAELVDEAREVLEDDAEAA